MSDPTADKMFDRILRSLKENSAEFARKERAEQTARIRQVVYAGLVFAGGVVAGALLMKVL
jgi:hypothetical protein